MKKLKISLIIIALAVALCMALCIILPACGGKDEGETGNENPPASELEPEDDDGDGDGDDGEKHTMHSYTILKSDSTGHWYECECGQKDENTFAVHSSTGADGAVTYDSDDTQHWEVCAVCGYDISGDGNRVSHSTEDVTYQQNATYHWHVCDVCGGEYDKANHNTSAEDGSCSICGYIKGELSETTIYMVGDSTMCSFNDKIYIPRYGYGTQLGNYLDEKASVVNLAMSGRSSKSFTTESNYTTLWDSIQEGDYLIIGFGHNDEKDTDSKLFTSANVALNQSTDDNPGFQDSLYDNYIKPAVEKGATPILCTPIVRYNANQNYNGSSGHVTDNGNYSQAIIDLGAATDTTVIDLTSTTKTDYLDIGETALWYHSYNKAVLADGTSDSFFVREIESTREVDGSTTVSVVPGGVDTTHLNMYGAKMVSYEFVTELANTSNPLADYILSDIEKPTLEKDFTDEIYYQDYKYVPYESFNPETDESSLWTGLPEGWYGSTFGNVGGDSKITTSNFTTSYDASTQTFTLGAPNGNSKIDSSAGDGFTTAFRQVSIEDNFTLTAGVKVTGIASSYVSSTQSAFGVMMRDDMYVDESDSDLTSTYVSASAYGTSSPKANIFRKDGELGNAGSLSGAISVGTTYSLKIERIGQTPYCTITTASGNSVTYEGTDFNFQEVDSDYIYVCLFVTRGYTCEFTNVTYTEDKGAAQGA